MTTPMYEIAFDETNHMTSPIRITEGKFKDFVYRYGTVNVGEFNDNDNDVPFKYEYNLIEVPASYSLDISSEQELADQHEFEHLIGDVLYDIIVNSKKVREVDGNRDNNTK